MSRITEQYDVRQVPRLLEVLRAVRKHLDKIRALDVEYVFEQRSSETGEEVILSSNVQYACKDAMLYQTRSDRWSTHGSAQEGVQRRWSGETCEIFRPADRMLQIRAERDRRIDHDSYVDLVVRMHGQFFGRLNTIAAILGRVAGWRIEDHCEYLGDRLCFVFEAVRGTRRFWVDPERGFAIRRHEIYDLPRSYKGDVKCPVVRIDFSDLRLAAGGVWLPWEIHSETRLTNRDRSSLVPPVTQRVAVRRLAANADVRAELFHPVYPPRTYVLDNIQHRAYRIGADGSPTEVVAM